MLNKLRIAKYRFTLEAVERLGLPRYKGSTLRGGFGAVFKRTVCFQREVKSCADCLLQANCPYAYIFETAPPQDAEVLRTYSDVPLPFVIEPPLDTKTVYEPGETLDFGLVLVGRAINYLPYFIIVFQELGRMGLGRGRGKYALRQVAAVQPLDGSEETIYAAVNGMVRERDLSVGWEEIEAQSSKLKVQTSNVKRETSNVKRQTSNFQLKVNFLTPTRMKHEGRFVVRPEFHVLVRSILRRVSSLYYFHCGEKWEADYRGIIEAARGVELAEARTEWVDWERYSRRQEAAMKLGGFVGRVVYQGDWEPFAALLVLGQLVHVGKACVFGHGKYEIVR